MNGADLASSSDAAKVGTFLAVVSGLEKSQSTIAKPVTTKNVIQQWNDHFDSTNTDMDGTAIAPLLLEGAVQVNALGTSVNRYVFDKFKVIAVAMKSDKSRLKIGDTANITFTLSVDPGSTFDADDIVLDGGTLGTLSGSGTTRTATFTPTANVDNGMASISVKATSDTGIGNTVTNVQTGSSPSISYDTKAPTLAITSDRSTLRIGETATITFTFSEAPGNSFAWDGSMGDVDVTGGTLSSLSGTGTTRTAIFTPAADTEDTMASITVVADSYFDAAGNSGTAGTTPLLTVDTVAPNAPTLALGSGITGSVSRAKITAASGVVSVIAERGSSVRVTFTDSAATPNSVIKTVIGTNAALGVTLASADLGNGNNQLQDGSISVIATATDAAGNTSTVGNALTISLDTLAPKAPTLALGTGVSGGATAAEATAASGVVSVTAESGSIVLVTITDSATPVPHGILKTITGTGAALGITLTSTDIAGAARLLIDGRINVTATITDAAGNPGIASTSFTLDTVAPTAVSRQTGLNLAPNTQQYAKLPAAAAAIGGDLTLEAWVYVRATQSNWVSILDLASATGSLSDNVELGIYSGSLAFRAANGSTSLGSVVATTTFSANAWHHLAATVVGNTVNLYVDGVSVAVRGTVSATPVTATRSSSLVGHSNLESDDFNGYIRDVRIYDDARSGTEIASDKGGSTPGTGTVDTSDSNLVGYYPFSSDASSGKSGGTAATLVGNPKFPIASLSFSTDTEAAGDFITRTGTQTISAKLGAALLADETLQFRLDSGYGWTAIDAASINGTSVTLSNINLPVGSHNLEFQVKDAAGNLGLLVSQPFTFDNKAYVPTATGLKLVKASSQFATLPASAANVSGDLTLEAWVYADGDQTSFVPILDLGVGANDSNLVLNMKAGQFGYSFRNGGTTVGQLASNSIFANNKWHHVAVVVGGDNNRDVTLYVNGEVVDSGSLSAAIASATRSSALVGKSNSPSGDPVERFNGTIRDVRIYDVDRTQAEIRSDMTGIVDINDANLRGYYPFSKNANSLNGYVAATLSASPVFTNPALSFSSDTGVLGDFKTSTTAQTITAKLSGSLALGEKVFGTVNGDAATPTWVDLSSFTSSGTVTWTGVTLGAT
ncbi:MAG: Ig-like domain-containing protein, partial [Rhodoferax sp.]|nr:Ig-like domain-containing protein [Rhodoferax sp.]